MSHKRIAASVLFVSVMILAGAEISALRSTGASTAAQTITITPSKDRFQHADVNDFAPVLTKADRRRLQVLIKAIRRDRKVDIVVMTVASLDGKSIEEFSITRGRQWRLGSSTEGRAILVTVAVDERQSRIEVSRNLEARLPDSTCKTILRHATPAFKERRYGSGFEKILVEISETLKDTGAAPGVPRGESP